MITASERLECLQYSVMLVDGAARVLFANAAARRLLGSGAGLACETGCLHSTDGSVALQGFNRLLHAQGARSEWSRRRNFHHRGSGRSPLRVTVTPCGRMAPSRNFPGSPGHSVAMSPSGRSGREKWMTSTAARQSLVSGGKSRTVAFIRSCTWV